MSVTKALALLVLILALIAVYACWPGPKTRLIVEISGGFAYVPRTSLVDRHLEVAYLNDVQLRADTNKDGVVDNNDAIVCDVKQVGTRLRVLRGNVVSSVGIPANQLEFDLDKTTVRFPALESAYIPLTYNRHGWKPSPVKPSDPWDVKLWQDLQYVPSHKEHHTGAIISSTWPNNVNGRFIVRGGKLEGMIPTDPTAQEAEFEFRKGTTPIGRVALTDRTIYTVDVPGTQVELQFANSPFGFQKLVLEPPQPGKPIRLRLRGLHDMNAPSVFSDGQELVDACAFYSLLDNRPINYDEWIKIHYIAPPRIYGTEQPSPGYFCNGDGF